MSISNAYDMGLLSRTFQVNNIFKVYLYTCTHNKPSRFIFSNSNIRHVIVILVLQSRTATIQIQKNRGAIEIRFVSVSSHIPDLSTLIEKPQAQRKHLFNFLLVLRSIVVVKFCVYPNRETRHSSGTSDVWICK